MWAPDGWAGPFTRHDEHRCRGGQIGSRLRRRGAFYKGIICMPTRRGQFVIATTAGRSHRRVTACTARRRGVPFVRTKGTKIRLGLRPKTPLLLSCGWIRTMLWHRSYGAADTLSRCLRRILFEFSRDRIKNQPYKRRLAPDPGGRRPSGRGKWGPRKVARPCGERRMHCSGEGCPKQSIGSARLKRRLRPTSVGSLGRSPE